jgi:hypothetical protein
MASSFDQQDLDSVATEENEVFRSCNSMSASWYAPSHSFGLFTGIRMMLIALITATSRLFGASRAYREMTPVEYLF